MKLLKKKSAMFVSILLAVLLACGVFVNAVQTDKVKDGGKQTASAPVVSEKPKGAADSDSGKDETVYVLANSDGSVRKIIVSDWVKNASGSASLSDSTSLQDIVNVKGEETYTLGEGDARVWDAQGKDIYYQGTTDKDVPVGMTVSYTLDGKSVSADELLGKSGRVAIRFDYENRERRTVSIDGKDTQVYVPFVMLTGLMLDNERFTNVDISNGRIVNDGDRTFAVGFALPGLRESLALKQDSVKIPEYVEITADVTDFELGTTMTYAATGLFDDLDLDNVKGVSDLKNSAARLSDAMTQLTDGTSALYDGLSTLLDKSKELISGVDQLAAGAKQLKGGADRLGAGATQLKAGMDKLSAGLNSLVSKNPALVGGAKQVFESMLSMADSQLAAAGVKADKLTIQNYASVLKNLGASLDEKAIRDMAYGKALQTVTAAVRAQEPAVRAKVETAVRAQVTEKVIAAALNMKPEQYDAAVKAGLVPKEAQAQVTAAVEQQMASAEVKAAVTANTEAQIQQLISAQMNTQTVKAQIEEGVKKALSGTGALTALKAQLDSYNQFYQGLIAYTNGVETACAGSAALASNGTKLADGAKGLSDGANALYGGLSAMQSGSGALVDGVSRLRDGSKQLSDGVVQFNEQGIRKLLDAFGGDLGGLVARLRATADASRSYQSFAGKPDGMDGSVKFIYKTDAIEK